MLKREQATGDEIYRKASTKTSKCGDIWGGAMSGPGTPIQIGPTVGRFHIQTSVPHHHLVCLSCVFRSTAIFTCMKIMR